MAAGFAINACACDVDARKCAWIHEHQELILSSAEAGLPSGDFDSFREFNGGNFQSAHVGHRDANCYLVHFNRRHVYSLLLLVSDGEKRF